MYPKVETTVREEAEGQSVSFDIIIVVVAVFVTKISCCYLVPKKERQYPERVDEQRKEAFVKFLVSIQRNMLYRDCPNLLNIADFRHLESD